MKLLEHLLAKSEKVWRKWPLLRNPRVGQNSAWCTHAAESVRTICGLEGSANMLVGQYAVTRTAAIQKLSDPHRYLFCRSQQQLSGHFSAQVFLARSRQL